MKFNITNYLFVMACLMLSFGKIQGQDIPLFSQKLSNSFLYNPSVAGQQYGSLTLGHRSLFSKINGGARDIYLSAHKPFFEKNVGVGINFFSENVNFVNNVFVSGAFAYHMNLADGKLLSIGLAGEYNSMGFDTNEIIGEGDDPLVGNRISRLDFSTGASFLTPDFELGLAVNRLSSLLDLFEDPNLITPYYSLHYKHKIRTANDQGLIEPMFNFRRLSSETNLWSVGGFYTYKDLILGGLSYQSTRNVNLTIGGNVMKKVWAGFSYQMQLNSFRKDLGSSTEFVLRFDLNKEDKKLRKTHFKKSKTAKKNQRTNSKNRKSSSRR